MTFLELVLKNRAGIISPSGQERKQTGEKDVPMSHSQIWDQFSSAWSLSRVQPCNPKGCSVPGFPVHHQLQELAQTHVHRSSCVSDGLRMNLEADWLANQGGEKKLELNRQCRPSCSSTPCHCVELWASCPHPAEAVLPGPGGRGWGGSALQSAPVPGRRQALSNDG